MSTARLTRSDRRLIGGVCAGLAEYLGWSVFWTRVVYVVASIASAAFPGILMYVILWIVLPARR
jgi:phage shock protein C